MEISAQICQFDLQRQEFQRPLYRVSRMGGLMLGHYSELIFIFCSVFVKEIGEMNKIYFDKAAATGAPVDFHDVMFKFTLDSFVL